MSVLHQLGLRWWRGGNKDSEKDHLSAPLVTCCRYLDNRYLCRISNGTVQLSRYLFGIAYCASHACVEYLE